MTSQSARRTENFRCDRCEEWVDKTEYCDAYMTQDGGVDDGYLCPRCYDAYRVPSGVAR